MSDAADYVDKYSEMLSDFGVQLEALAKQKWPPHPEVLLLGLARQQEKVNVMLQQHIDELKSSIG